MKPIISYTSCLEVLKDAYTTEVSGNPHSNLKSFAHSMGMAQSTLHMILNGKRNLTLKHLQRLSDLLKLVPHERDFLETLFLRSKSVDGCTNVTYARKLRRLAEQPQIERLLSRPRYVHAG